MSTQLDQSRIAIRERDYAEVLDLAFRVTRAHAGPLAVALAIGVLPLAALNAWLLSDWLDLTFDAFPAGYLWWMFILVLWEIPLATAPMTLYLGQVLFAERAEPRKIAANFFQSLPQLIVYQVLLRGLLLPAVVTWFLPFSLWPYLNEVILLERNSFYTDRTGRMTTGRRRAALHGGSAGDLFVRWILGILAAVMVFAPILLSLWILSGLLLDEWAPDWQLYAVYYPAALWLVAGFFAVVRFLGYLDLRIRREGWEVELLMRAEGARLARHAT